MSTTTRRYRSNILGQTLDSQGRKGRWLAGQVGISESSISRLVSGKQTVAEGVARQIALILGSPFSVLFESAETDPITVADQGQEEAA